LEVRKRILNRNPSEAFSFCAGEARRKRRQKAPRRCSGVKVGRNKGGTASPAGQEKKGATQNVVNEGDKGGGGGGRGGVGGGEGKQDREKGSGKRQSTKEGHRESLARSILVVTY